MKLSVEVDQELVCAELQRDVTERVYAQINRQLSEHFASRAYWGVKDGVATIKIKQAVDDFILSPRFDELVAKCLEKNAPEAIERALKNLLASKSRKAFFEQIPHE